MPIFAVKLLQHLFSDEMRSMFEKSPIRFVEDLKIPTLLLVGKNDLRVHPSQSFELYRSLKSLGRPVELIMYDDGHSLSKLSNSANALINAAMFFEASFKLDLIPAE